VDTYGKEHINNTADSYRNMPNTKFMQSLNPRIDNILKREAKARGILKQDLIRIAVSEWLAKNHRVKKSSSNDTA
jgi:hypothetical protein